MAGELVHRSSCAWDDDEDYDDDEEEEEEEGAGAYVFWSDTAFAIVRRGTILLPGIDHLPCRQEIRSVKDKPFYCQSSVGTRFCFPELIIFHAPLHLSRELGQGFMGGGR